MAAAEFRGHIYDSIIDTIGATPLVRLSRLAKAHGVQGRSHRQMRVLQPACLGQGPHRARR